MNKEIMEKLYDAACRIDRIIFIGGSISSDALADDIDSFFDEEDDEDIVGCFGEIPDWVDIDGRGYERADSISEWLLYAQKLGFLVKFATPVMEPTGENSRSFSWGYYNTKWLYAETLDEAIEHGLAWVQTRRDAEDEKAAKGGDQ